MPNRDTDYDIRLPGSLQDRSYGPPDLIQDMLPRNSSPQGCVRSGCGCMMVPIVLIIGVILGYIILSLALKGLFN